jgi:succinate dehydrogenase/fumarate reductase flavoprotein subunit
VTDVHEYDVVVAGSGSAGMSAAIVAAHHGLKVLLVEKTAVLGGTTAWSGGGCWVPANQFMSQVGLSDTKDAAREYVNAVVGKFLRRDLYETFLEQGPRMLDFMFAKTQVRFMPRTPAPDYRLDQPGALIGGRSLGSVPYDGRLLGPWLKKLRRPLSAFNAPWGMMMSPLDLMHALNVFKSRAAFWYMTKLFARYAVDLLRFGRGTRLTMGNALAARLIGSAVDAGVTLWTDTAATRLLIENGRVSGLIVTRQGREMRLTARKGVVLACGGFSSSAEWREKYFPQAGHHRTVVAEGNTGDGLRMALEAGATMQAANARNGVWQVVSTLKRHDGSTQICPHFFTDIPKPGCIAVNVRGERFGNEANLELGAAMHASGAVPAWLICDHRFIKRYGLGLVYPFGIRLRKMLRAGYLLRAHSLHELGTAAGIDGAGLERGVARYNEQARAGVDRDFGKGASAFDRTMGDPAHQPNPCLAPIEQGPYYALKIYCGDVASVAGLNVNVLGQPLNQQSQPIPGLYACGLDMNSLWSGTGLANGAFHAQNMTFGYIIGRALAGIRDGAETPVSVLTQAA